MLRKSVILIFLILISTGLKSQSLYFPPLSGNTWDTISPSSLGWCQPEIDSLLDYLEQRSTKAFLVLKDGKIVIEHYFGTFTVDSSWYWASAGKTVTAVLTGIAQQESFLDIDDTTSNYLGTGWTVAPLNKEEKITIRHQLTMTSGLDDSAGDPYCTDDTCLVYLADAGTRWAYHNGPYTLLDDVLQQATGVTMNSYFTQKLALTTGMSGMFLPSGYNNVFYSKPRSMARFGLLMLNEGNWNGNQVLDIDYFHDMVQTSQAINPSYGYLWWLNGKSSYMLPGLQWSFNGTLSDDAPADMYSAMGKNGQILNVVPSQDLIMIRMGDPPAGISAFVPNFFNDTIWQKFNAVMCSTSSLQEIGKELSIYPNPARDRITIESAGLAIERVVISDIHGRYILKSELEGDQLSLPSGIAKGIYIVEVHCRNNSIHRKQLIIE